MSTPKTVAARGQAKRKYPMISKSDGSATVVVDGAANVCYWNDESFNEDLSIAVDGTEYECSYGNWVKVS